MAAMQTCETISQVLRKGPTPCTTNELCLMPGRGAGEVWQCLPHHILPVLGSHGVPARVPVWFPSAWPSGCAGRAWQRLKSGAVWELDLKTADEIISEPDGGYCPFPSPRARPLRAPEKGQY